MHMCMLLSVHVHYVHYVLARPRAARDFLPPPPRPERRRGPATHHVLWRTRGRARSRVQMTRARSSRDEKGSSHSLKRYPHRKYGCATARRNHRVLHLQLRTACCQRSANNLGWRAVLPVRGLAVFTGKPWHTCCVTKRATIEFASQLTRHVDMGDEPVIIAL